MDFIWILFAYICGWLFKKLALPPLIGYLAAGFLMNAMGFEPFDGLQELADLGITLMLFTIGLKLNIRDLIRPDVFVGALGHMSLWILVVSGVLLTVGAAGLPVISDITFFQAGLIAFALSFSSTVCVVKMLEESGEMKSRQGTLAIGILILQDIIAVAFLVVATGKVPSVWALSLILLVPMKPVLDRILTDAGHAELLPLSGFFLALGAYEWFSLVGLKGDLGALIMGAIMAGHIKSAELAKSLLSFKDLFLIGFFVSIGFTALPTLEMLLLAIAICLLLLFKLALFFALFTRLKLRVRTSFLASSVMGNYSEFGLIVVAICVANNWLPAEWLVVLALAVSLSFVGTSIIYRNAHQTYANIKHWLIRFEKVVRVRSPDMISAEKAEVLVIGLGRVGEGAYRNLRLHHSGLVMGFDSNRKKISSLAAQGYDVAFADGEDAELWQGFDFSHLRLVLLTLPTITDGCTVSEQLRSAGYQGKIAAMSRYDDESPQLLSAGANAVLNMFAEAGIGFAEESLALLNDTD